MDMKDFLSKYVENLQQAFFDHTLRVGGMSWACDLCPLKEQCHKDSEENPDDNTTCGQFICRNLTDGKEYKA